VIPGSNPVFGLNSLGGAVAVTTKSGFEFPGTSVDVTAGSFGRRSAEFETGGHGRAVDYFLAGTLFEQRGWSDRSTSRVQQAFAKTGYQDATTDLDLSFAFADNRLQGSQDAAPFLAGYALSGLFLAGHPDQTGLRCST